MLKILLGLYLFVCLLPCTYAEIGEDKDLSETPIDADVFQESDARDVIECIENFEQKTEDESQDVPSLEETEIIQEEKITALDDMINLLNANRKKIRVFLMSKGVDRVIVPNLSIYNTELRTKLLILTKILFEHAPIRTRAMLPVFVVDKLLDIFENDDHLPLKAHSLDVLCLWLPDNPRVQARVMKVKGLEPFYQQITKLDVSVFYSLLDLFNRILNEHLKFRNDDVQRNGADLEKQRIYQSIGLIERVSTPTVCNGLLSVFETAWSYSLNNEDVIIPVFELIKKIKPFCAEKISHKMVGRGIELFESFAKHVKDLKDRNDDLNLTEIEIVLQEYIDTLKRATVKDEL